MSSLFSNKDLLSLDVGKQGIQMSSCDCAFSVVSLMKPSSGSSLVLVYSVVQKCKILWPCIYLTPLGVSFLFICFQCVLYQMIYHSFLYVYVSSGANIITPADRIRRCISYSMHPSGIWVHE